MTEPLQEARTGFTARLPATKWARIVLGIVCGTAFLVIISQSIDVDAVFSLMSRIAWLPVVLGVTAYMFGFILRSVRFWSLVNGRARGVPFRATISPFIASFGISDILPLRLGDVFRIFWFNRRFNLPMGDVIAAMILERMLDLVAIVLLATIALNLVETPIAPPILATIKIVLVASAVLGVTVILSPTLLDRIARIVDRREMAFWAKLAGLLRSISTAVRDRGTGYHIIGLFLFSLLIWLLESLVVLGAWISLGGPSSEFFAPFFSFAISTLGTLVPALPGHFGSYEYFGILAFDTVRVDKIFGAAVVLLSHLMLWLPTALFGIGWLILSRKRLPSGFRASL